MLGIKLMIIGVVFFVWTVATGQVAHRISEYGYTEESHEYSKVAVFLLVFAVIFLLGGLCL
jgi:hypothetical protein